MVEKRLLENKMKVLGISKTMLARELGINRTTYFKKENGYTEFKVSEIRKIIKLLKLTYLEAERIFKW